MKEPVERSGSGGKSPAMDPGWVARSEIDIGVKVMLRCDSSFLFSLGFELGQS